MNILGFLIFSFAFAEPKTITIGAGGDVGFGRYRKTKKYFSHGGEAPFASLEPLFQQSDVVFVNLETPLSDVDPPNVRSKRPLRNGLTFRSDTRYAQMMVDVGIDVVSLANNHMEDCRKAGLEHTQEALEKVNLYAVGAHTEKDPYAPVVFQKEGVDIIVFARSTKRNRGRISRKGHDDIAYVNPQDLVKNAAPLIESYKQQYPQGLIVFSIHWGEEYSTLPTGGQQRIARALVDTGVDIVLGHHPHVLQPAEVYKSGLILYSMGNFVFDQYNQATRKSAFFAMDFHFEEEWKPVQIKVHPLQLSRPPETTQISTNKKVVQGFVLNSKKKRFGTKFQWENDILIWKAEDKN